jgi:hypothetical protein
MRAGNCQQTLTYTREPTGRAIDIIGTGIFRVVDGKVTDNWVTFDALSLLQQLGVVPSMR